MRGRLKNDARYAQGFFHVVDLLLLLAFVVLLVASHAPQWALTGFGLLFYFQLRLESRRVLREKP